MHYISQNAPVPCVSSQRWCWWSVFARGVGDVMGLLESRSDRHVSRGPIRAAGGFSRRGRVLFRQTVSRHRLSEGRVWDGTADVGRAEEIHAAERHKRVRLGECESLLKTKPLSHQDSNNTRIYCISAGMMMRMVMMLSRDRHVWPSARVIIALLMN